jgi:transcriptional regulator with XRE-family HTH domain
MILSNLMDISQNIKAIRDRKGLSQASVADLLQMERTNYHRLEKRGNKMTIEQLQSIADALGVPIVELLGEKEKVDVNQLPEHDREVGYLKELLDSKKKEIDSIKAAVKDFISAELYKELVYWGKLRFKNIKTGQVVLPIIPNDTENAIEKGYIKETLEVSEEEKKAAYDDFIFKHYLTVKLLFRLELVEDKELKAYWEKFNVEYGDRIDLS